MNVEPDHQNEIVVTKRDDTGGNGLEKNDWEVQSDGTVKLREYSFAEKFGQKINRGLVIFQCGFIKSCYNENEAEAD